MTNAKEIIEEKLVYYKDEMRKLFDVRIIKLITYTLYYNLPSYETPQINQQKSRSRSEINPGCEYFPDFQ